MKTSRLYAVLIVLGLLAAALLLGTLAAEAAPEGGVVGSGTPASCTEAALDAALSGGGAITFNCGTNPYTITLANAKTIAANTTLDGGGKITLSGGDTVKVFIVNSGIRLTLNNITVAHGSSALGGCVLVQGTLNATQATFRNCTSRSAWIFVGAGGAIFDLNGTVALTDSFLLNNSVEYYGGGLYASGGQVTLNHVSSLSNTANMTYTGSGGGVYVTSNSNFFAYNSSFSNNHIGYTGQGGGVYVYSSTALLVNSSADNNRADNAAHGGGIYAENSQLTMQGGSASGNDGLYAGGGLWLENSISNISNAKINSNTASSNGGGLYAYHGSLSLDNSTVSNNTVGSDGGGIHLYDVAATFTGSAVNDNYSERNGGGIDHYRNTLTLDRVTVSGNRNLTYSADGGGIYNSQGTLIATNSTIDHNTTDGSGGGIYNGDDSTSTLTNVTLSANTAAGDGGALYNETNFSSSSWTVITLTNITAKDNIAAHGGGLFNGSDAHNLVYLKNTVLADSGNGNCQGQAPTSAKYTLSTDGSCNLIGIGNVKNTNAELFPLQNNGGTTRTHLPASYSPVVDGVSGVDCPLADQRGVARPQGLGCDRGAVERQATDPAVTPRLYLPLVIR